MENTTSQLELDDAFVVITDYERFSVVLSWDYETHDAPKVIAKEGVQIQTLYVNTPTRKVSIFLNLLF